MHVETLKKWLGEEASNLSWDQILNLCSERTRQRLIESSTFRRYFNNSWFQGYLKPFYLSTQQLVPSEGFLSEEQLNKGSKEIDPPPIEVIRVIKEEDLAKEHIVELMQTVEQLKGDQIFIPSDEQIEKVNTLQSEYTMMCRRDYMVLKRREDTIKLWTYKSYSDMVDETIFQFPHLNSKYLIVDGNHRAFGQLNIRNKETVKCVNYSHILDYMDADLDVWAMEYGRPKVVPREIHILLLAPWVPTYNNIFSIPDLSQNILSTKEDCLERTRAIRNRIGLEHLMECIREDCKREV